MNTNDLSQTWLAKLWAGIKVARVDNKKNKSVYAKGVHATEQCGYWFSIKDDG